MHTKEQSTDVSEESLKIKKLTEGMTLDEIKKAYDCNQWKNCDAIDEIKYSDNENDINIYLTAYRNSLPSKDSTGIYRILYTNDILLKENNIKERKFRKTSNTEKPFSVTYKRLLERKIPSEIITNEKIDFKIRISEPLGFNGSSPKFNFWKKKL